MFQDDVPFADQAGIDRDAARVREDDLDRLAELGHVRAGDRPARGHVDDLGARREAGAAAARTGVDAEHEDVVLRGRRRRPRALRHLHRHEAARDRQRPVAGRGDAALDRRRIGRRRALDRDRDAERRAACRSRPRARPRARAGRRSARRSRRSASSPRPSGAGAATPSSCAPGAVTGSLAVSTISLAEVDTEPSAGADETSCRSDVVEAHVRAHRRGGGVAERVVADRAQVVEAVGDGAGVEGGAERRARVGADLRPGAGAGGRDAEGDADGAAARASRSAPTVPETTAPGSASVTLGPVESTVTGITAVVRTLPAASVISGADLGGAVRRARRVPRARRTARSCRWRRR